MILVPVARIVCDPLSVRLMVNVYVPGSSPETARAGIVATMIPCPELTTCKPLTPLRPELT